MKIGILTQPLHNNYGGMLQAYALQSTLRRLGHEPWILQREHNYAEPGNIWRYDVKNVARFLMGRPLTLFTWEVTKHRESRLTHAFIERHITPRTGYLKTTRALRDECRRLGIEAYVVGSDQVWRPMYSPRIENYFLDFLLADDPSLRVAYAASFGTDEWEYSAEQAARCGALLRRFTAVSVRERGGVDLCQRLGRPDAVQVLDPTLLLSPENYETLAAGAAVSPGRLFCYVLDRTPAIKHLLSSVAERINLSPFEVMPKKNAGYRGAGEDGVYPDPAQWIRAFMDAQYVVTDSFHGTVFSILFHRPFVALGNSSRGQARFTSLLSLFGLENRLLSADASREEVAAMLHTPVDWARVDERLAEQRNYSIQFLTKSLKR